LDYRNLPEGVRVIHHGREKIDRLDDCQVVSQFVNAGVVHAFYAPKHVRVGKQGQAA